MTLLPATMPADWRLAVVALVLALATLLAWWRERQRRGAADAWHGTAPRRRPRPTTWLRVLLIVLAGGAAGTLLVEPAAREADDTREVPEALMVVLDMSRSMEAADVAPSRIDAARAFVIRLTEQVSPGVTGLLLFAGEPALVCPLTTDPSALQMAFGEIAATRAATPGGSAIGAAVLRAVEAFGPRRQRRTLLLVSDGEETTSDTADALARARAAGVTIHAVGVGTRAGMAIPTRRQPPGTTAAPGEMRVSRLAPGTLMQLAAGTGGLYVEGTDDRALAQLAGRLQAPDGDPASESSPVSMLLLLGAFVCLVAERWVGSGTRG